MASITRGETWEKTSTWVEEGPKTRSKVNLWVTCLVEVEGVLGGCGGGVLRDCLWGVLFWEPRFGVEGLEREAALRLVIEREVPSAWSVMQDCPPWFTVVPDREGVKGLDKDSEGDRSWAWTCCVWGIGGRRGGTVEKQDKVRDWGRKKGSRVHKGNDKVSPTCNNF